MPNGPDPWSGYRSLLCPPADQPLPKPLSPFTHQFPCLPAPHLSKSWHAKVIKSQAIRGEMEPAERIGSGTTLGKRQRSRVLPRSASMVTMPSAAKQGRQEGTADVPSSSSLLAGSPGVGAGGGGEPPRGYFPGGYFAVAETAAFLKACGLCNRRLGPGHDTFIYRGEVAFCSQECREQQIEYDERMEQTCSLTSSVSGASGSDQSGSGGETVAAA